MNQAEESQQPSSGGARHPPARLSAAEWKEIAEATGEQVAAHSVPVVAAGVAFYAWIATIPTMVLVFTTWGLVADPQTFADQLERVTAAVSPTASSVLIDAFTQGGVLTAGNLTLGAAGSVLVLLWTGSSALDALIQGVNTAYGEPQRSFVQRRKLALMLTIGGAVFALVALGLLVVTPVVIDGLGFGAGPRIAVHVGRWAALILLAAIALAAVYRFAPNRARPRWRWVTWGAAAATVLWLIASAVFSLYVTTYGAYGEIYGALGGVIALNLWLLVSAFVTLLGAEIDSAVRAHGKGQ